MTRIPLDPRPLALLVLAVLAAPGTSAATGELRLAQDDALTLEDLEEVDYVRRRGGVREARADLEEILAELPDDALSRALLARCAFETCEYERAEEEARAAYEAAREADSSVDALGLAFCARELARIRVELGRPAAALEALTGAGAAIQPDEDARDAWITGRALLEAGERERAFETFGRGAEADGVKGWDVLLAQARCQRALGFIRRAATTLVAADVLAKKRSSAEPDVLVELGDVYFEAYGEVDNQVSLRHSPAELYNEALVLNPRHEGALLGLFAVHRHNWMRSRYSTDELLGRVFEARPDSLSGLVLSLSTALDDGELPRARDVLARLENLAPGRRDVQAEKAALAWVEHRRDDAHALLETLTAADPFDARAERVVGEHLLELYRFAEGLPFLQQAVERDPRDWNAWTQLGRAQANTGDEDSARTSLAKAVEVAEGRSDAWRDNTKLVLSRMHARLVEHDAGSLSFAWEPDAAPVFERYLVPFYAEAREELAARYGYTPSPTHIEVFRRWVDFSVRSTGFEGFPALGVCFGPVVTAVSPLSELRGSFSWARTSFHEFTHVIHLGLSHNRCPRWVTEGLATWEEGVKNPAWKRNMRRDLVDARANDRVIPVRKLNNSFRGPRVLFAYYQSGLLCEMLIRDHGFPPMVRLLEAFDAGKDLDGAFRSVFDLSPEEIEHDFLAFVDGMIADLAIEPRWSPEKTFRLRFSLSRTVPEVESERAAWADDWCTVAWGFYYQGKRVDAEEALRLAASGGAFPARGEFLNAELALQRDNRARAREAYQRGVDQGGVDYRAFVALGRLLLEEGEDEKALSLFERAEAAFPGFPDANLSAEMALAQVHDRRGDERRSIEARMRWLAYNAGDYDHRIAVADWLHGEGRYEEAVRYYREANEVDPFRRQLHERWGKSLFALGRYLEAVGEFEAALLVAVELDGDATGALRAPGLPEGLPMAGDEVVPPGKLDPEVEAELRAWIARSYAELGRVGDARQAAERALALDPDNDAAQSVLDAL